jgi:hypothetical protein
LYHAEHGNRSCFEVLDHGNFDLESRPA